MIDFDDVFEKRFDVKIIVVVIFTIVIGIYFVNLIFGRKSFSQMLNLQNSAEVLEKRVKKLKKENALLQKEYFELKELEGN